MILYVEIHEDYQKQLKLIRKFNTVSEYKINIQKLVVFLYNSNKISEREIKKTVLFTIASKRIKHQE